jgi:hypothetical protein
MENEKLAVSKAGRTVTFRLERLDHFAAIALPRRAGSGEKPEE